MEVNCDFADNEMTDEFDDEESNDVYYYLQNRNTRNNGMSFSFP